MAEWATRRAEHEDAEALVACFDAAYARYASTIPDLPDVSADCAAEIANCDVWVAEASGGIVGGLVLIPEATFMMLANVAVHPSVAGTGLGRKFMALAEIEAERQGFDEMRLTTHRDMAANIEMYMHLGWDVFDRTASKVSMKKRL